MSQVFADFTDDPDLWGEAPPEGDIAWIWFKPANPDGYGNSLFGAYHSQCAKCDTFGVKEPGVRPQRCWSCGRFVGDPEIKRPLNSRLW